jgi:hypothetical protein
VTDGVATRPGLGSALLALVTSSGTLVCCTLPALLVSIGAGAALSSLVSTVPQLVFLSEHKGWVFAVAAAMLALAGAVQWRNRTAPCPVDPALRASCLRTRRWSLQVYGLSVVLFAVGVLFAYGLPLLMGAP